MAYEKQTWVSYDDNKTEEQNIQDGAVVTAERMNHLEQGLVEHESDKKNPHEVTAEQTGAYTKIQADARYMRQMATNAGAEDWNTYTEVGTYGIASFTGANSPTGISEKGSLLVQPYGGTGRIQTFITKDVLTIRRFNGTTWEPWTQYASMFWTNANFMVASTTAIVAQDWNTLTRSGTYSVENSTGANKPTTGNAWGQLLVQNKGNDTFNTTQLFISAADIYFRRKVSASAWSVWQKPSPDIATQEEAEDGEDNTKSITPLGVKQHVDKRIATQAEVTDGEANDKLLSPKGLADTIKFTEVFLPGSSLSNVAIEGTVVPHGNTAGGSINYIKNRPYTVNSDGSFTFKRATNLLVTGGMKLVVGDTNPTDYLYVNAYVNNALNEFIALGATAATNGTLRLTWSAMGQRVISVNSGDVLSLKIGLRSGKQAFAVQLTSLKIEEV